jgi:16S rRNA (guanine1516-N2)-methyltransferase
MGELILVDYTTAAIVRRLQRIHQELIVKAFKSKTVPITHILDATAGYGIDGLLLAQAGYQMTLIEKRPTVATVLQKAHQAGLLHPETQAACQRMTCVLADSFDYLKTCDLVDAIYLDPMFSVQEKDRLGPKKMQLIHQDLLDPDDEHYDELLSLAQKKAKHWVVVKRPRKAPPIGLIKPHSQIVGRNIRFDRYIPTTHRNAAC